MNTPAIDHALTLLDRTCDYAAIEPAREELATLKSRLAELESRRPGDVRTRTVKSVRWEVRHNSFVAMFTSLPAARNWVDGRNDYYLIIRITTYAVTRPVVRETSGSPGSMAWVVDGEAVAIAWWSPSTKNGWLWGYMVGQATKEASTRAEAEQACRKALRDMGYRVERATA